MAKSKSMPDPAQLPTTEDSAQSKEKSKKKREESLAFRALELSKEDAKKRKKKSKKDK